MFWVYLFLAVASVYGALTCGIAAAKLEQMLHFAAASWFRWAGLFVCIIVALFAAHQLRVL
jgi:hypothetical protein